MKKKVLIIGSIIVVIIAIVLIVLLGKPRYTIMVSLVDDQSPDRILTVYNEKKEKVQVRQIEYLDGTLLCKGFNTSVHFGEVNEKDNISINYVVHSIIFN